MKKVVLNSKLYLFCWLAIITLIFAGCSTQKDQWANRTYHQINAKYNGLFNAEEIYKETLEYLEDSHEDNYEQILHIFQYAGEQEAQSIESDMDIIYEKASVVIQRHSMNIDGVEHNKWIDNAYLLIAKSHFFKQDYNHAILTFDYIIRQFDTPLKYKAKIWVAKTNNFIGRFNNSKRVLDILESNYNEGQLPEEYHRFFFKVYADYYYKQDKYEEAIPYVNNAIENTGRRGNKTRLTFILGQTHQELGNYAEAQNTYSEVLDLNPGFDMDFRTRINMAMAYDPELGGGRQLEEKLKNMLTQTRNRNYRDQVYYALAKLSLNQGLMDEAIDYYKKSTRVSDGNDQQKGLSFLNLGQIYYDKTDYYTAHSYLDSAATFLPSEFEDIEKIKEQRNHLSDLVNNIDLINREDSLQHLASLSERERNIIIDNIIEHEKGAGRQGVTNLADTEGDAGQTGISGAGQGGWYFYNNSAINFGKNEFVSRWGERELEDNWRISATQSYSFDEIAVDDTEHINDQLEAGEDPVGRENYLADLPLSTNQLDESNKRIMQAYYDKALIYKDQLNDAGKAVEAFETMLNRFPDNEHQLYAYYFLYDIHKNKGSHTQANRYKNKITNNFPNSDFAKILSDPDYARNIREQENVGKEFYKNAYFAFNNKNFEKVFEYCQRADTIDLNKELKGQFAYLEALTYGVMGEINNYSEGLKIVVNNYENTNVYEPAKNILAHLDKADRRELVTDKEPDKTEAAEETAEETAETEKIETTQEEFVSIYEYKPETIHFFIFIVNTDLIEIQQLRNVLNDFNREAYPDRNLTLSNIYLEDEKQILTVTNFENSRKALDYYDNVLTNDILANFNQEHLKSFTISVENYPTFFQEKNIDDYLEFYNHYY